MAQKNQRKWKIFVGHIIESENEIDRVRHCHFFNKLVWIVKATCSNPSLCYTHETFSRKHT
jgi:hypothetical protein